MPSAHTDRPPPPLTAGVHVDDADVDDAADVVVDEVIVPTVEVSSARMTGRSRRSRGKHKRPPPHPVRSRLIVVAVMILAVPVLFGLFSIVGALRTPGNYSFKAKWADWLRSHHSELVVQKLENVYFKTKQVKRGGTITKIHHVPGVDPTSVPASVVSAQPVRPHLDKPAPVSLVVQPAAPGEGQWLPTGPLIDGLPGMYVSQFRADDVYTSQITNAVWVDPKLLRIRLMPGAQEPGGDWNIPHNIEGGALDSIAAAFNGGFRFQDAHGGFYLDGREAVPLVDGAASIVIYSDGRIDIGSWNREVRMTPKVEGVLQNLVLMVDNGAIDPQIGHNDTSHWGATLGANIAVARSGIGVTASGALVYVAGPSLTAKSLAESLQRAGAVRAMTLDINPEWVTFNFFQHPDPAKPSVVKGEKLYPGMQRSADRYLSSESRDFFTIATY